LNDIEKLKIQTLDLIVELQKLQKMALPIEAQIKKNMLLIKGGQ